MRPFDPQLLRWAPQTRRPVIGLGVVGILQGLATIALAFALSSLVVAVVTGASYRAPAIWLLVLFAGRAVLAYVAETTVAWAGVRVAAAVRARLVSHWLSAPAEARPDPATATTLTAQGCAAIEPYAARFLPSLIHAAVVPPLAILALLVVDWKSGLIVIGTLPLLPLFAALIGRTTAEDTDKRWQALSALAGHFLDVMRGLPTLVAYGRGERQVEQIREVSAAHRRATMRTLRLAFMSSSALELLATISVAIVAVTVGVRLANGSMDLGPAMLAILLSPEAYWPIRRVGAEFHSAADGAQALVDISQALSAAAPTRPGAAPVPFAVTLDQVSYTYPGSDHPVVSALSFMAGPGLTVLTGPSGAGKSTVLELVAGVRTPDLGEVASDHSHLVSQRPFLFPASVRDNLTLGNDATDDAAWTALREVGLDGVIAGMPQALDTRLGDDGFGLSAGQRTRLVLARALLSGAPVLLLDEPTAHLDPDSAELIGEVIAAAAERHTVIAVSHSQELVNLANQVVEIMPVAQEAEA